MGQGFRQKRQVFSLCKQLLVCPGFTNLYMRLKARDEERIPLIKEVKRIKIWLHFLFSGSLGDFYSSFCSSLAFVIFNLFACALPIIKF